GTPRWRRDWRPLHRNDPAPSIGGPERESAGSGEGGRRRESAELALQEPRELDAGSVAVLRADDLHADRQSGLGEPDRRHGGAQVAHAGMACPEQLVGGGHALAVNRDRALRPLAEVVVRECRRGGGGAEQEIVLPEESGPRKPHPVTLLVGREPVAVR